MGTDPARAGAGRVAGGGGIEAARLLVAEGAAVRSTVLPTGVVRPSPTGVQSTLLSIHIKMLFAVVTDGHVIGRRRALDATQVLPRNFDREARERDHGEVACIARSGIDTVYLTSLAPPVLVFLSKGGSRRSRYDRTRVHYAEVSATPVAGFRRRSNISPLNYTARRVEAARAGRQ